MKIPFLDLNAQYTSIKYEINSAIQNVLDSGCFILGKAVSDFENNFAKMHNVMYCSCTSSGTDANHTALWALGIKPGDEVIIPANTFIATAWGVTLCGATPVFVDCDPNSYTIASHLVEKAITKKTKAIVAVHLYGQAADMNSLMQIAKEHNLFLIEDAAQAHLAEYRNQRVGGLSDSASFSFYPGKNLGAYGEGGAVVTNNIQLAKKHRMIRDHGCSEKYKHEIYGHNYRMEAIQGAILDVKLKYIEQWTEARRLIAEKYNNYLSNILGIVTPTEVLGNRHVYHLYVIQVYNTKQRDNLAQYLKDNNISTGLHYPIPLHLQNCFKDLNYPYGSFPVTEKLAERGLSLPIFPEMTAEQIEYVCYHLEKYFKMQTVEA